LPDDGDGRVKSPPGYAESVEDRQVPLDLFVGRAAELARVTEIVARVAAG
jgi:hypothetical protein